MEKEDGSQRPPVWVSEEVVVSLAVKSCGTALNARIIRFELIGSHDGGSRDVVLEKPRTLSRL